MNCPYCNNVIPDGAANCQFCGAQVAQPQQQQQQQYQQQAYQQPQYQQPQYQQQAYQQQYQQPQYQQQYQQAYQQQQYQQPQYQQQAYQQQQYQQPQYQQQAYQQQYQQTGYQSFAPGCEEQVGMFTALKKYAQFSGRSRRKEYWLWVLCGSLVSFAIEFIGGFISGATGEPNFLILGNVLSWIWSLATFLPSFAVAVRRLHDTGRSGWNVCWALLPIIGWIMLLIFYCQDSQFGQNQYGYNPKGMGNDQY